MLVFLFVVLMLIQIVVVVRYVDMLGVIAFVSKEYDCFFWSDNKRLTNYDLLRDPRFYFFLTLNKFNTYDVCEGLRKALKTARVYLLMQ